MNNVTAIQNHKHFEACLSEFSTLQVAYFYTPWSKSCQLFAQEFVNVTNKFPDSVQFLKIDIERCEETARAHRICCTPTFVFYVQNEKVAEFSEPNGEALTELIERHKSE
ncbi:hypothetical protein UC34_09680 [Pandoraea vervacti]|uniref:Thioredoxin domain-containing protein n=1 Tax=Pandoraea vervacti TaxID=656178 RepID=A0ABM5SXK2_9BURK|nr:thioredoxin family protein [Pandoraea vervacti]AJP57201.1 hypothetical protein UC34_09680 [Pandoraea vervacti]